eukprot:1192531-Prorocentrum_minimum.AAC.3
MPAGRRVLWRVQRETGAHRVATTHPHLDCVATTHPHLVGQGLARAVARLRQRCLCLLTTLPLRARLHLRPTSPLPLLPPPCLKRT